MKRLLAVVIVVFGFAWLSFPRYKTVEWNEEVPLNTGETIWVQRVDPESVFAQSGIQPKALM